ncbi:MAG: hypothetical protein ACLFV1_02790 [Thiohalophilus sp.]
MIELSNRHGSATLTTHGGTLLSYQPASGEEVIWLSERQQAGAWRRADLLAVVWPV